eukprot:CAMPEP_0117554370 /NCGR_PEP_ID=MMETSP0784-20121206/50719_1 /TAXON_ID=39447 /ORGANISM="" /LENGTH=423 /DNA_ID=CAMNT_0005351533 /DNA_START=27 /DNA_END=1301 /DNA_ORIENTATION=-
MRMVAGRVSMTSDLGRAARNDQAVLLAGLTSRGGLRQRALRQVGVAGDAHDQGRKGLRNPKGDVEHDRADENHPGASDRGDDRLGHGLHVLQDAADGQAREDLEDDHLPALRHEALEEVGRALHVQRLEDGDANEDHGAAEAVEDEILQVDVELRSLFHRVLVQDTAGGVAEGSSTDHDTPASAPSLASLGPDSLSTRRRCHKWLATSSWRSAAEGRHPNHRGPDEHRLPDHAEGREGRRLDGLEDEQIVHRVDERGDRQPSDVLQPGHRNLSAAAPGALHVHREEPGGHDELAVLHDDYAAGGVHREMAAVGLGSVLDREVDGDGERRVDDAANMCKLQARVLLHGLVGLAVREHQNKNHNGQEGRLQKKHRRRLPVAHDEVAREPPVLEEFLLPLVRRRGRGRIVLLQHPRALAVDEHVDR